MTARSHERGWPIEWNGQTWIYSDTKQSVNGKRACLRCGRIPTSEGHDACLEEVPGVESACCGHGAPDAIEIRVDP